MNDDDCIWSLDGGEQRREFLMGLVARYLTTIDDLLPQEYDDPIDQLDAELTDRPDQLVTCLPELERLFPPALADAGEASQFRADVVAQQARVRVEAARTVLADLAMSEGDDEVFVPVGHMDAWVRTLTAVRVQWHVVLTGSTQRTAEATQRDHDENPTASAIVDWLGFLTDDAIQALNVHGGGGRGRG